MYLAEKYENVRIGFKALLCFVGILEIKKYQFKKKPLKKINNIIKLIH